MTHAAPTSIADLGPIDRLRQQQAWNWYDWANSAYYTTVLSVMFAPYMITVAGNAAGCADPDEACDKTVSLLGLHLAAGSLPFYLTSFATILSAFILPVVGAVATAGGAAGHGDHVRREEDRQHRRVVGGVGPVVPVPGALLAAPGER